jgi:hypothetical protein
MDRFKYFLINESKSYLGHRVNDILTALQDIQDDMENLGTRHLSRLAENVVNEIRKILHGQWEVRHHQNLEQLQKVAVAIMKTIEDKGDLREILPASVASMQKIAGGLGVKTNELDAPEMPGESIGMDDFEDTGNDPTQQEMPQQGDEQPPMEDPMGQSDQQMGAAPDMNAMM